MNTPAPGTWVAHDGQPNQIWQVARLETRGGTTYAHLHHPHRRTNGHFSPDPKAPETMTVVAADLTAVKAPDKGNSASSSSPMADKTYRNGLARWELPFTDYSSLSEVWTKYSVSDAARLALYAEAFGHLLPANAPAEIRDKQKELQGILRKWADQPSSMVKASQVSTGNALARDIFYFLVKQAEIAAPANLLYEFNYYDYSRPTDGIFGIKIKPGAIVPYTGHEGQWEVMATPTHTPATRRWQIKIAPKGQPGKAVVVDDGAVGHPVYRDPKIGKLIEEVKAQHPSSWWGAHGWQFRGFIERKVKDWQDEKQTKSDSYRYFSEWDDVLRYLGDAIDKLYKTEYAYRFAPESFTEQHVQDAVNDYRAWLVKVVELSQKPVPEYDGPADELNDGYESDLREEAMKSLRKIRKAADEWGKKYLSSAKKEAKAPARQSFADQEDTIKKGAFFVQSPSLKPELAPVAFFKTIGEPINEGTETIILTEAFYARLGPFDGNVRHLAPMRIKLPESTLTPAKSQTAWGIAQEQVQRTLGKDAPQYLFDRSDLSDVITLARTIDRIDDVVLAKRSIQEAYELLSMLDDGYLLWDKLMLMLSTEPKAGILWYERLERLLNALPETNGKIPVNIRKKYAAEVKRLGYGTENAFTPTPDDPAGQGYHAIGTYRAAKLVRPNPDNDGLPIYYLWDTDDEVYYLFSPSLPNADLGSRTAAEAKADFTPKELPMKPNNTDSGSVPFPPVDLEGVGALMQWAINRRPHFYRALQKINSDLSQFYEFEFEKGSDQGDGVVTWIGETPSIPVTGLKGLPNGYTVKIFVSFNEYNEKKFRRLSGQIDLRFDGPSGKYSDFKSIKYLSDGTFSPEKFVDKMGEAIVEICKEAVDELASRKPNNTPDSKLQTPDSSPLTAPLIEARLRVIGRMLTRETNDETVALLQARQRILQRALDRA